MKLTWKHYVGGAVAFVALLSLVRSKPEPAAAAWPPPGVSFAAPAQTPSAAPEPRPAPRSASADPLLWRTVGGHVGAVSRAKLDQVMSYVAQGDPAAFEKMLATDPGVFVLAPGLEVVVVDSGGVLGSVVRIRKKGTTAEIWTVREAIEK